jgi:hypothetical protein
MSTRHNKRRLAAGLTSVLLSLQDVSSAELQAGELLVSRLTNELRGATAVQVLLISPGRSYAVTLIDREAAKGRVHMDGCRYSTQNASAVVALSDIVASGLTGAGEHAYTAGSGGGDLRVGLLFERNGEAPRALYIEQSGREWARGVFEEGWLRFKPDTRDLVEAWVARPDVQYVGVAETQRAPPPPGKDPQTGQMRMPCTKTEMTVRASPRPLAERPSPELRAAPPPTTGPATRIGYPPTLPPPPIGAKQTEAGR